MKKKFRTIEVKMSIKRNKEGISLQLDKKGKTDFMRFFGKTRKKQLKYISKHIQTITSLKNGKVMTLKIPYSPKQARKFRDT